MSNIGRPSMAIALAMIQNTTLAVARYDLFGKWLRPTPMDKAELELHDAWWVTPEQKKKMGDHQ